MKKIMIVIPDFGYGGGQSLAVNVVSRINCSEMDFLVVSLYPSRNSELEQQAQRNKIKYLCLNKTKGISLKTVFELSRIIREYKPDVLHAHLRVMISLLPAIMIHKIPKVLYTVHNIAQKDGRGYLRYVLLFSFKVCNVQPVGISDYCRQTIAEYYHIPINRIPCIYVGTNNQLFSRKIQYEELSDELITFVAVGRLTEQKNYSLMINAFIEAQKVKPNIRLQIIGKGEDFTRLNEIVETNNKNDVIKILGYVPDLIGELEKSHVYLMSSDWEGLPQSVLEAMAIGLPVVSTKAGGVIDIIKDGENGFLVECGDQKSLTDAIIKISNSKETRVLFSKNNIQAAKKYSIERCASEYKSLYLE